jgi:hypothetical protein
MKPPVVIRRLAAAFTLIELTLAMSIGLITASMTLVLFNQQIAFLKIYGAQNFLISEAPVINAYLQRMIGQAERFALYANKTDALAGTNPVAANASVLLLQFQQPDGTVSSTILSFETVNGAPRLNYYLVPVSGALSAPQWSVTTKPTNVVFAVEQGILRIRLTGPAGELITFSGEMQQ